MSGGGVSRGGVRLQRDRQPREPDREHDREHDHPRLLADQVDRTLAQTVVIDTSSNNGGKGLHVSDHRNCGAAEATTSTGEKTITLAMC